MNDCKNECVTSRLTELQDLFHKMISIIVQSKQKDLSYQVDEMNRAICLIDSLQGRQGNSENVLSEILSMRNGLFPQRGGLTEFHIWGNDFQTRLILNEPVKRIKDRIWELIK